MNGPTVAPEQEIRPIDPEVQHTIERNDYAKMLKECIPTLKADHAGAVYLQAVLMEMGDAHVKRAHFLKAAARVTGGHPPFMELALQQIEASKGMYKQKRH